MATAASIARDRDYAMQTADIMSRQQAELDRQAQGRLEYQATYGKKADRLADRQDAAMATDLRMKEQQQLLNADRYKVDATLGADRYKVDATTGAEVKVAGIGADAQKYMAEATLGAAKYGADMGYKGQQLAADTNRYGMDIGYKGQQLAADTSKYGADMGYKGQQLAADTSKYGMDRTFDLGSRQLSETGRQFDIGMADKGAERTWESGEKDKDRSLAGSLAGFQATLALLGGSSTMGRGAAAPNNYWR